MRRAIALLTVILAMTAAACSGSDSARPRSTLGLQITTTSDPPLDGRTFEIGQEFWHSGFRVELVAGEVWTSSTRFTNRLSYWVTLRGEFENLGDEIAPFDPEIAVLYAGTPFMNMQGAPPTIIGGESALGELTFQIPEDFDPWLSEIMVGALGDHRAVVPLAGEGDVARLAPSAPDVGGVASTDLVDLDFTGAVLRYDDPLTYSQLADGTRGLTLYFDVTSRVDGRRELTPDHFTLVLADGSEVGVAAAELGRIEGSEEGMTTTDRFVSFVVDAELDGDLAVRFAPSEDFLLEDGLAEALFEFSL